MFSRTLVVSDRHFSPVLKSMIKRPRIFSAKLKQIPVILSTATYRSYDTPPEQDAKFKVKYVPCTKKVYKDHDHKNMSLGRPMSPHLTIYAPTLPAMTSIVQRITGMQMSAMTVLFAISSLVTDRGIDPLISLIQSFYLPEWFIILWKTSIAFAFTYHFFMGIRFVMFNLGKGLDRKVAYMTASVVIVLSLVSAVACALIGHLYSFKE